MTGEGERELQNSRQRPIANTLLKAHSQVLSTKSDGPAVASWSPTHHSRYSLRSIDPFIAEVSKPRHILPSKIGTGFVFAIYRETI